MFACPYLLSVLRYEHHGFTDQCAAFDGSSASALGGMMLKVGVTQTRFFPLTIQACRGWMSPNHKHTADALGLNMFSFHSMHPLFLSLRS